MDWLNAFKPRFSTLGIVLLPVCIAIDWAGHAMATGRAPLFLDSIGTIIGAIFAGPWIGGLAGFVANLLSAGTIDSSAAAYACISLLLGFAAGIGAYLGWQRDPLGWINLWLVCVLVASIGSTPLNLILYSGKSHVAFGDSLLVTLQHAHFPLALASFFDELSVDLPDKLVTVAIAVFVYQAVPLRYRSVFRLYSPADSDLPADRQLTG
jgi:energy-coupling factor transport system substrate-specific component